MTWKSYQEARSRVSEPTRRPTERGQIITFTSRLERSIQPKFCDDHPGVLWAAYVCSLVVSDPLSGREAIPAWAWAGSPDGPPGVVMGRAWRVNGKSLSTKPKSTVMDLDEEEGNDHE